MSAADEKIGKCTLKHEIRESLWGPFARKIVGPRPINSYLTLYSPPMMDIKHFKKEGLLTFDGRNYNGVVAVTDDLEEYDKAISQLEGRPELLLYGDINDLIKGKTERREDYKALKEHFPFQVINLDYCNALYRVSSMHGMSKNLSGIQEIIAKQYKTSARSFALFITTLASRRDLSPAFLDNIESRLARNFRSDRTFRNKFTATFDGRRISEIRKSIYEEFTPLGIVKLVSEILAVNRFKVVDADGIWLYRDNQQPQRHLLHLAFQIQSNDFVATSLKRLGKPLSAAVSTLRYVTRRAVQPIKKMFVSRDESHFQGIHGQEVLRLFEIGFELKVPEPKNND